MTKTLLLRIVWASFSETVAAFGSAMLFRRSLVQLKLRRARVGVD
jgi:hypothetical protein